MLVDIPAGLDLAKKAVGILVFPRLIKGGVVVGGEFGEGALLVNGQTVSANRASPVTSLRIPANLPLRARRGGRGRLRLDVGAGALFAAAEAWCRRWDSNPQAPRGSGF